MKGNHNNPDFILERAIAAVRDDQPDTQTINTATANAWQRISQAVGIEATVAPLNRIEGCADVQSLLADFEAHRLSPARAMLVADHLRECATCRVHAKTNKSAESVLPWRANSVMRPRHWSFGQYALAASVLIAAVLGVVIGRSGVLAPSGYRAALESVNGVLYRVDATGEHQAKAGDQFAEGEIVRTSSGSRAMLRLRDGSLVEMNGRSELYVTLGWRNTTVNLGRGIVIVQAAKRRTGHLYVKTADARVAVTGTIFSVNSGIKGSRVSVIEGTVHVAQAAGDAVLQAGDQVTTSTSMGEVPVKDEIAWSQDRDRYLALLAEFVKLEKKLQSIKLPDLRYESHLINFVADGAVVYAGVPNYGEALQQANQLFQQQLSQSALLREWWEQRGPGASQNGPDFNQVIDLIHGLSTYVGDEIVFSVSSGSEQRCNLVVMAEIAKSGLRDYLTGQISRGDSPNNMHLLSPEDLGAATQGSDRDFYVLITPKFVAASPDVSMLADLNRRWSAGEASSFAQSDFGKRIASEYSSGAGLLIAVNLEQMRADHAVAAQADRHEGMLESSGFANAKYLIAQRKDYEGKASNTAELSFTGPRTGVASWLAAPAPIGALDFITPNASAVGAFVSKSPALMVDDLLQVITKADPQAGASWEQHQAELNLDIRNDLAASLGGEGALALDGPLLPTPSWKLVVEVYDPSKLQYSLGRLVEDFNREAAKNNRQGLKLEEHQSGQRTYYSVRSLDAVFPVEVHYAFADGYVVAGPSEELVAEAIRTRAHRDSNSIAHSEKFRALFPADQHVNVSGLIYQNLAPVTGKIAKQLSPSQLQSIQALVQNTEPSVICAYGDESQIEFTSNSKSLGLDLKSLAISSLLQQLKSGTPRGVTP
ncbi:MAG TPA: FecR domain-containing protein [Terriglobales bacterium]|jgi:hypothetical protein|nr:FecR domain-containing protein [Terriglobales bacterium]